MRRRDFLRATAAIAAGGSIAPLQIGSIQAVEPQQLSPSPTAPGQPLADKFGNALQPKIRKASRFFEDPDINYVFLTMLGGAYYRTADIGACLAIADQIVDGDRASAFRALLVAGDRLSAAAETASTNGLRISARDAYMQAANYVFSATYFVNPIGPPDAFAFNWLRHQELWDKAAALLDPPADYLPFPYEKTTLPGYFFKVDNSGLRRPLIILNNGSDGGMVAAWTLGIAAALERGYNAYTFYGPGQGTALLKQKLYFRPDWENVVSRLLDYLLIRREVDASRIALVGISQGGYWAPRAAAFDSRIAACVADPGVWDVSTAWSQVLPKPMLDLLAANQQQKFDNLIRIGLRFNPRAMATLVFRMRPFGITSPYEAFKAVQQYNLAAVAKQIRCPMLITDPEGEQFWPGQSQKLYDALAGPKTLLKFTAAEGGDLHCEPKTPGLRAQRIFDWLDQTLKVS
jgi:alpha-beta hydrolase superfamily lysophospholipase